MTPPPPRRRPPARRPLRHLLAAALVTALTGLLGVLGVAAPAPAAAAGSLQQVTNFGANPGNLQMYAYVPAGLPANAPLVVALHGCTQSANAYYSNSGWPKFADKWHFAVVFPQTTSANNIQSCFSWFDSTKDTRDKGEAASVRQMVSYAQSAFGSDPKRVYVTGLSAGGGMAADLLADYPDVFAGGSVDSGLPAQCATTLTAASGCQMNNQNLSPGQWGDKVRASYPGYSGPWPRVAIWQGSADYTVYPVNGTELRDQWTDVWGTGQTASSTATLPGNTTESLYDDSSGKPAVALFQISGMGHGLPVDPGSGDEQCGTAGAYFLDTVCSSYYTAKFWGLDGDGGGQPDPGTLPAPTGLKVTATTDTGASLSWNPVSGASSYTVHRNGTKAGTATATSFTDTGLTAGTTYAYTVAATGSDGRTGSPSAAVSATTTGGQSAQCFTATNYAHVAAGRAHTSGGYTYADGSNQNMGLYNVFTTHTLKQTGADTYVIADSGCGS
ncbi:PHB depolymerase family esterase [Streptomyces sp. NPDC059740]|uniref:extracellular catalytic domain type 1 short-chain-length polyhydroxyalkanoate depolymerase n=1 Tax=Streptomyces sp. NPDC059740 TaxID=3346926 RepID=UPI00365E4AF9